MEVSLAAGANPIFLSGNFLTRHADQAGDLVCSGGTALRHRLYDMDPAAPWASDNASDVIDETVTAGLWEPGFRASKDVDFLAVLGSNVRAFDADFSNDNGLSYPGANQKVYTNLTTTYKVASFATQIAADKVKLTLHTTQTANVAKQVGTIVVAEAQLQTAVGMSVFQPMPKRVRAREARMHDGSTRRAMIYRSDASYHFNDFAVGFTGLTEAQAEALMAILLGAEPFIFYPFPGERPAQMYLGQAAPGTVLRKPMTKYLAIGETVTFDFEEIGGA